MKHTKCSMSHYASHHERKRVEQREGFFLKNQTQRLGFWFLEVFTPHGCFVIVQEVPSPKLIIFLVFFVGFRQPSGLKAVQKHSLNSSYVS